LSVDPIAKCHENISSNIKSKNRRRRRGEEIGYSDKRCYQIGVNNNSRGSYKNLVHAGQNGNLINPVKKFGGYRLCERARLHPEITLRTVPPVLFEVSLWNSGVQYYRCLRFLREFRTLIVLHRTSASRTESHYNSWTTSPIPRAPLSSLFITSSINVVGLTFDCLVTLLLGKCAVHIIVRRSNDKRVNESFLEIYENVRSFVHVIHIFVFIQARSPRTMYDQYIINT